MASEAESKPPALELGQFADVFEFIARLHDREPETELIDGARQHCVAEWLGGILQSDASKRAIAHFETALREMPDPPGADTFDDLAAEYADIYLNHSYRIAPTGSVWMTEDRLERQEPMFAVRRWYTHYGVEVPDWRKRSDDHIVNELLFVAHLCRVGGDHAPQDLTRFVDENVLPWVPQFAQRLSERARLPFFIAVGALTEAALEELRDHLFDLTGIERPQIADPPSQVAETIEDPDNAPYMPGLTEGW